MLNSGGESRHPCLVPVVRGKSFSLLPVSMMLALGFFVGALYQVEEISFYNSAPNSNVCIFSIPPRNSLTPAGCPMCQLNSDLPEDSIRSHRLRAQP